MGGARVPARPRSQRVLLATRNEGKRRELEALLAPLGMLVLSLDAAGIAPTADEEGIELFASFEENALAKARHFSRLSGMPAIADDSGLEVDALGGRPGVRSRRWSGRDDLAGAALDAANNEALLRALAGVPRAGRGAGFVCAAAWSDGSRELVVRGAVRGWMLEAPRGSGGFGYDPYFLADELGCTFAEASREEKGRVSHRGRALRALLDAMATDGSQQRGH